MGLDILLVMAVQLRRGINIGHSPALAEVGHVIQISAGVNGVACVGFISINYVVTIYVKTGTIVTIIIIILGRGSYTRVEIGGGGPFGDDQDMVVLAPILYRIHGGINCKIGVIELE